MNKSPLTTVSHQKNHLVWIGIGVFSCLVLLTCISLLDLKKDLQQNYQTGNLAATITPSQNVASCPFCGTRSLPQCFFCGNPMQWNTLQGTYFCPRCQRHGNAFCPYCRNTMIPQGIFHQGPKLAGYPLSQQQVPVICPRCNMSMVRGW